MKALADILIPHAQAVEISDVFGPAVTFPTIGSFVAIIVQNVMVLAGVIAFIGVVISGVKFIQAAGDAKALEQNKGAFTASIIGFILIVGAYFIIEIIQSILGFNFLSPGI